MRAPRDAGPPPVARPEPKELNAHGHTRVDPYSWLRDRDNPATIAYLETENAYTAAVMCRYDGLRRALFAEIKGRVQETDESVPYRVDDWFYYVRTEEGLQYPLYCRKHHTLQAPEEIILDQNRLATGHAYFRLGNFAVSPNHDLLAYSTDTSGDETYTIRVKRLDTGELLPDSISNTYYSLEWAADNRTFFYTVLDETKRPYRIYRHELGATDDALVYDEPDGRYNLTLDKTRSREFIFIDVRSSLTSETRYLRTADPLVEPAVLLPRTHDVEYTVSHQGDWFYLTTNQGAKNFRLIRTPVAKPSAENTEEIQPERPGITILGTDAFANHLVILERESGLIRLRVRHAPSGAEHFIQFDEPVYSIGSGQNAEYNVAQYRFTYTSLVTPLSVYDYDMDARTRELKKRQPVLGGYDPEQYASERIQATAPDGTKVPISIVYRKGAQRDGSAPMLLYGYGSYGIPTEPAFSSDRLSLLDRGLVFAMAHIRGGGDLGKYWHDDAKFLKKRNTFTDFIAAADHLVAEKYTSPDRLGIMGGSAGGLLMGAVVNMRPDLFASVVAKVPFVDVVTTMLDATLPLTIGEYEEWGNPEDKQYYDYMLGYSPYDNVEAKRYPAMLVTGGLNDPRVSYWEPAKWVAKLRATKTDDNVLLLKMNMGAGHGGPSGRYDKWNDLAFDYAFLLASLGITQ